MIRVEHLTKTYNGRVNAVDDLSFTIEKGQIYGFLGPNGAGKSTTMNIVTGYISATSGSVTVNGHDIFQNPKAAKRCIGYLPEQPPLYTELTPREYLKIAAGLKDVPRAERKAQIEEIMELTGISGVADRLIRHLSKGYKQRVGLAQAMIGYPEILILDEPTVGLDPKQIIEMRELIRSLRERHTVILSSHILSEVSAVCDTVMIISKGKLVASDTPENLSRRMEEQSVLLLTVRGDDARVRAALDPLKVRAEVTYATCEHEENAVDVCIESADKADLREEIFFRLADARLPLLAMNRSEMTLEDVFLELTEDTYSTSDESADEDETEYEVELEGETDENEAEGKEEEEC
ncbi:MAG: ABC transporter ATP-binding protein [Clostridia bacterium]|nr:ABC transporter ATP-binding protein [Clostridia bacterium]